MCLPFCGFYYVYIHCFILIHPTYKNNLFENHILGTSLAVQWLRLQAANAGGVGLILVWATKISHALRYGQKYKKKKKKKLKATFSESNRSRMWARSFVSKANFLSPREEYPSWVGDWDNKGSPPTPTKPLVWHFLTHPPHPALRGPHANWPLHRSASSSMGWDANKSQEEEGE